MLNKGSMLNNWPMSDDSSASNEPALHGTPGGRRPGRLARRLARLLAPSAGRRMDRTADFIGAFAALLGLALSTSASVHQWQTHQMTPRDSLLIAILLPAVALTSGWITVCVARRRPARPALVVHTALCLFGVIVAALLWQVTPGQLAPPLAHSAVLGAAAAWTCLYWPFAALDIVLTVTIGGTILAGTAQLGSLSWVNSAYYGAIGMVATMGWTAVVDTVRMAQYADRSSRRSERALIESEEALAESNRWDGLIHDKVLNALGTAARAVVPQVEEPARILARDALGALRDPGARRSSDGFVEQIRRKVAVLGLDADIAISGIPIGPIAECYKRAAGEALTNVARHSGVTQVRVWGHFGTDAAELSIRDEGCGFNPGDVSERHHGLSGSVRRTMAGCGGRAEVISSPGHGTTVTMYWQQPRTSKVLISQLPAFRMMMGFFILALVISLSMGVPCSPYVINWHIEDLGLAILVLAIFGAMLWPRLDGWKCTLLVTATMFAQIIMLANLRLTAEVEWQEWFIGFSLGVFAPLAWRTRNRRWCVVAALSLPVVTAGAALLRGWGFWWLMTSRASSFTFPVVLSMAAAWAAKSMDAALSTVHDRRERTFQAIRRQARAEAVRLETERRLATIEGAPLLMLERLADGVPIDAELRRECALLEVSMRDLLVAPLVMDDAMRREFRSARERGAKVVVAGREPVDGEWAGLAEAFREVCVKLAAAAGAGSRLTCRWAPGSHFAQPSVALSGGVGSAVFGSGADSDGVLEGLAIPDGVDAQIIESGADVLVILTTTAPDRQADGGAPGAG